MFDILSILTNDITQRALLKVDEEVSTLRTQLQNQSPPSTRIGAGDQTSHHVAEFRERDNNSFNQVNPNPYNHNEIREVLFVCLIPFFL
jgi:hypothetical protein